jgi:hypothetical protein
MVCSNDLMEDKEINQSLLLIGWRTNGRESVYIYGNIRGKIKELYGE